MKLSQQTFNILKENVFVEHTVCDFLLPVLFFVFNVCGYSENIIYNNFII
jgi:hypothetical protein